MIAHGMPVDEFLMFLYVTGEQAAVKFKNLRDRWLKIVSAHDVKQKSGAPGKAGRVETKWALFDVLDSVLRDAPIYAKSTTTNLPNMEGSATTDLPSTPGTMSDHSSSEVSAGSSASAAQQLLHDIYSEPADIIFEDDDDDVEL
ncbi:uncharacterized protein LOC144175687 [Haemaphysalis longicornis]